MMTTGGKRRSLRQSMAQGTSRSYATFCCGVLSLNGKETHEYASRPITSSSGSVLPSCWCAADKLQLNSLRAALNDVATVVPMR